MAIFPDVTPTWVQPDEVEYDIEETYSGSNKRQADLMSSLPLRRFSLYWSGVTDGDYAAILKHWRDVSGTYAAVTWDCVPNYIDGGGGLGVSMTGHWAEKPEWNPESRSWNLRMIFEKDI